MKTCTKCKAEKPLAEFHNCASKTSGKFSACKTCRNSANRKKAREIGHDVLYQKAIAKDPDGLKRKSRAYYLKNREKIIAQNAKRRRQNPDEAKDARRRDYLKNKTRYIKRAKDWVKENPEKRKIIARGYSDRFRKNPKNRPALIARRMLSRALEATSSSRNRGGRTFDALGYSMQEFVFHMERQFLDGMSWENHGEWHVDHIIPVSEMVSLGVNDPKDINSLNNLRPLWAKDNLTKSSGFDLSVQVQP